MNTQAEVARRIKEIVADIVAIRPDEITDDVVLGNSGDHGDGALLDSLDVLELGLSIERDFAIPPPAPDDLPETVTLRDVATYVFDRVQATHGGAP